MKIEISNAVNPSLIDMDACANILRNGFYDGKAARFLDEPETKQLSILLAKFSRLYVTYRDSTIDEMTAEISQL